MRATIELANSLKGDDLLKPVDNIYADTVPAEELDTVNQTTLVITESLNQPTSYGNNTFNEMAQALKVAIYYSLQFDEDTQVFEIKLYKLLESMGWRVDGVQPTYFDEVTNQAVRVFQVSRLMSIEV